MIGPLCIDGSGWARGPQFKAHAVLPSGGDGIGVARPLAFGSAPVQRIMRVGAESIAGSMCGLQAQLAENRYCRLMGEDWLDMLPDLSCCSPVLSG